MSRDRKLTPEEVEEQEELAKQPQNDGAVASMNSLDTTELEKRYQRASNEFKAEWPSFHEKLQSVKNNLREMIEILTKLHRDWAKRRIIQKISDDHKDLVGFNPRSIWRSLSEDTESSKTKTKTSRMISTTKTRNASGQDVYRADEAASDADADRANQEELGKEKQIQSLQIELTKKSQALSYALEQIARLQTLLKNVETKPEKGGHKVRPEEDQAEIEITVNKEKPDGSSLYRELYGIMAKKVEVFYLKCVIDKKGDMLSATAIEAVA